MHSARLTLAAAVLTAQLAGAQQVAEPQTFEVATVKLNRSGELRPRYVVLPRAGRVALGAT